VSTLPGTKQTVYQWIPSTGFCLEEGMTGFVCGPRFGGEELYRRLPRLKEMARLTKLTLPKDRPSQ
jgi:hypothetical protein